ncbi:twin-arginine translocase subunit TatC [Labilibaculum manganireducens]|uniref:Sec-independent protein translocase protein TatC n=1 Tax=Labilibaculum manganireducens TaxID=1940525 RepID=A0A2N3I056_9BACT|nr:twin-arginine translocase subunit TatC [Labilibaculum manganireducens]PKQ63708.1 twin arginine-targeting protein translocase TatC [Labilibaculum manganireducens]
MSDKEATNEENQMSFLEHLEELRWHLMRSVIAVMVFAIAAFIFYDFIFNVLILAPKNPEFFTNRMFFKLSEYTGVESLKINTHPFQVININMAGQFATHISVSLVIGIIASFPYIFYEFWSFLKPALYDNEKKHARGSIFYTSFLFALGVLFGYYLITPLSVHFLGSYSISNQVLNQINLTSYISSITSIVLASGVIFELPVLIFFLSKIGLVSPEFLKKYRKHSVVLILILSAIITPPDIFSQILVCLPLMLLYEIGIKISKRVQKNQQANLG